MRAYCQSMAFSVDHYDPCRPVKGTGPKSPSLRFSSIFLLSSKQIDPCCNQWTRGVYARWRGFCREGRHVRRYAVYTSFQTGHAQVHQSLPILLQLLGAITLLAGLLLGQEDLPQVKAVCFMKANQRIHPRHVPYQKKEGRFVTFSSSTQFSKIFCTTKLPVSPSATSCHMPLNASLTLVIICGGSPLQRSSNSFCQT